MSQRIVVRYCFTTCSRPSFNKPRLEITTEKSKMYRGIRASIGMLQKTFCMTSHCSKKAPRHYSSSRIISHAKLRHNTTFSLQIYPFSHRSLSTSSSSNTGNQLYEQAMELIQRAEDIDKQLEEERSKRMFEAWQNSQEAELNPKQQGVKVIKTLVKETKKKRNEKSNQSSENCRQQAQALLNQAAYEHGQPEAAVQLGNTLLKQASDSKLDRSAQEKLVTEALRLFQKAGQSGSRVGWYNHGHLLWTGFPPYENDGDEEHPVGMEESLHDQIVPADMHEAMESFIKAIDLSCYDSMYLVGVHRLTMGGKENYLSGTRLIERAANAGHGGALYYLALLHLNGEPHIGLEPCSLQEFVERLDKAADAGNVDARFVRGHSYYHGTEGYPQNFSKALDDFLKAADEGHADAAVSAGAMFHNGVGAPADQTKAFELYQLAGELGSEEGWANVVDCWRQGLGVPKSEDTAKYIEDTMLKKNTSPQ